MRVRVERHRRRDHLACTSPGQTLEARVDCVRRGALAAVLALALLLCLGVAPAFAGFGFAPGSVVAAATNEDGSPDTLAGSHPFAYTTTFKLNTTIGPYGYLDVEGGLPKDVSVELPPGLIGNPNATTKCTEAQFNVIEIFNDCPNSSVVGYVKIGVLPYEEVWYVPLYNMVTPPGVLAEFGFQALGYSRNHIRISLRSGSDYGLTATLENISQAIPIFYSSITLWGDPSSPVHNFERGTCLGLEGPEGAECPGGTGSKPLLNLPTQCAKPLMTTFHADSWNAPGEFVTESVTSGTPLTGCEGLDFTPSLSVSPETTAADSPSGLAVDLHVPQEALENSSGTAEANLKGASVTLPAGLVIDPAVAAGLEGCSSVEANLASEGPADCPEASKIGTVEIETPVLEKPLGGAVYVASPYDNPFDSLLAIYLAVHDPQTGAVIKLAGHVVPDPETGQLTATFSENPQLPFEDLKIDFFSGQRAALATPQSCGSYTTSSQLTSWSEGSLAEPLSSFQITSGPNGSSCSSLGSFSPSFSAGTLSNGGGAFGSFSTTFSRQDGEQSLSSIRVTTPPGLLGMLSSVPLCDEAQANAGTCSSASEIGTTTVAAGAGPDPVYLPVPGQPANPVYLTTGYKGAPYGLSFVVPAVAGPFNLGTVVVRAAVSVNPYTSQITISSDPLPSILDGIPVQIRSVNVNINRPGFMFNPTNCGAQGVSGTITSGQGTNVPVAAPFQAVDCATLPFKPVFTASTGGQASKADGASLTVKIAAKGGPQTGGGEANIKSVKVDLPKQLPSRLSTLQLACTEAQFNANPAGCPKESDVGTATAATPVLAHPLEGPAYLVSHGGAAFPDLEIVLQGEGITLILDGQTNIKDGITSSTFKTVPDAPISSFELKLPTGAYSILGTDLPTSANYRLCGQTLAMPTMITGQNGAVIKQTTKITITGCPKAKTLSRAQKLTRALKACKKDESKSKRAACEATARKHYAPTKTKKHKK
jgi:hypothetical protein